MQAWEVDELFEQIKIRYDNFSVSKDKRKAWFEDRLQHIAYEDALANLRRHVAVERFPPTLADLCRPLDPAKDESTIYHESMKVMAQAYLADLENWQERAVGPTPEQREKVWAILGKRNRTPANPT